jgi:Domain of unknown function (DUF4328)
MAPGAPMTQAHRNHTYVPPRASAVPAARPAPRMSRHVKWVATRPAAARAAGRRTIVAEPAPTPHYDHNPGWGLIDIPPAEPAASQKTYVERMAARLPRLLIASAVVLVLAAIAQTWVYVLLVINLESPVGHVTVVAARTSVIATGVAALGMMLACLIGVAGWLMDERRRAYARHDQRDPRSPEQIMLGCWIPILNLVKPLAFFRELLDRRDDLLPDYTGKRLWWLWTGWLLVNALVIGGLGIRIFADTLVWQSNALALVIVSNLLSAVFAVALWWTITRLFAREAPAAAPKRFLVAA